MTDIKLCTWNAGNGTREDLDLLMSKYRVIAGQEWGDREELTKFAKAQDWRVILGDREGSDSTPLLVSPGIKIKRRVTFVMLENLNLGEGAGPSETKQKCAVGGLLSLDGTVFGVASTHLVASQQFERREKAARRHVRHLVEAFDGRTFPWFICGDFNCVPDSPQLRDLYRNGWTNTAKKDKPLSTHENRCIDYIWWERSKEVHFGRQRVHDTRSDHDALGASFRLS